MKRFGYVAGDVFEAVFDFDTATTKSQIAFDINFQQLKDTVASRAVVGVDNFKRIFAISPPLFALNPFAAVHWKVDFISGLVAAEFVAKVCCSPGCVFR